jgi:hypothetical protein
MGIALIDLFLKNLPSETISVILSAYKDRTNSGYFSFKVTRVEGRID